MKKMQFWVPTGSIGTQTLEGRAGAPDIEVVGLSAGRT